MGGVRGKGSSGRGKGEVQRGGGATKECQSIIFQGAKFKSKDNCHDNTSRHCFDRSNSFTTWLITVTKHINMLLLLLYIIIHKAGIVIRIPLSLLMYC